MKEFSFAGTESNENMTSWIEDPGLDNWKGLRFSELGVDEAFLNITSTVQEDLWLYALSEDCERCPYQRHSKINLGERILKISTKRNMKFRVLNDGGADIVAASNIRYVPLKRGVYTVFVFWRPGPNRSKPVITSK